MVLPSIQTKNQLLLIILHPLEYNVTDFINYNNLTEQKIQNSINKLMKNKTSVIIAHRLSSIEDADLIYVLDKGKIVGEGRHNVLFAILMVYREQVLLLL